MKSETIFGQVGVGMGGSMNVLASVLAMYSW